ncbi:MAG: S-adenosylmethionine:tRNA ribosyltransferase-isomerase [Elusimicrobia bacterium]|nr:S-adenosylmethionine:tRNA ribosyltransferase-isomerase [Elusimicrobiota bacterium]
MWPFKKLKPFRIDPDTLDFQLPEDRIAQEPTLERDQARLLVLNRQTGQIFHRRFFDLIEYLRVGDVLVLNKAKVSKAKLMGKKGTGGKVEVIFLEKMVGITNQWKALVRPLVKEGQRFQVGKNLTVKVVNRFRSGEYALQVENGSVEKELSQEGRLPLPPYIKRSMDDPRIQKDERDYQTIYAEKEGSVAAPTAGLHFSEKLLSLIKGKGVHVVEILLHVGWGTFKPIIENVSSHQMLPERFEVTAEAFRVIKAARADGRRVIAVGTTSTRTLESLDEKIDETLPLITGSTDIFIQPGYRFNRIDALITNLHVPRSTPVSLTAAFSGLKNLEKAYAAAIGEGYRFYSYGDAMLVF